MRPRIQRGRSVSSSHLSVEAWSSQDRLCPYFSFTLYLKIIIDSGSCKNSAESYWRVAVESVKLPQQPELLYSPLFYFPL